MNNKLLPIGSIVKLKEAKKRLMIIGYFPVIKIKEENKIFDYVSVLFPEGVVDSEKNIFFNHTEIGEIIKIGLIDEEVKEFLKGLIKIVNENNKKVREENYN